MGSSYNDDEFDEHFLDTIFVMGGTISKGIQWEKYSEIEIQGILKLHFEYLGYNVIWRHRDDPANERGVDLECINNLGGRVAIAVKKKPNKNALGQLVELSSISVEKRVYVYFGGSTQSFRDNLFHFSNVDFWDEKILEEELNETELTLRLKIDNSLANQAMQKITYKIFNITKSNQKRIFKKNSSQVLETLWGLKDRVVTVQKCATMLQLLFEESEKFGKLDDTQVQNLAIWGLDYLYVYGLLTLQLEFESLSPQLFNLLKIVYEKTRTRSNWFELLTYTPRYMPGRVLSTINRYDKQRRESKIIKDKYDNLDEADKFPIKFENTKLDTLANEFRFINIWSDVLEGTINYMFQYRTEIE